MFDRIRCPTDDYLPFHIYLNITEYLSPIYIFCIIVVVHSPRAKFASQEIEREMN